jgi:hypothetical protein
MSDEEKSAIFICTYFEKVWLYYTWLTVKYIFQGPCHRWANILWARENLSGDRMRPAGRVLCKSVLKGWMDLGEMGTAEDLRMNQEW